MVDNKNKKLRIIDWGLAEFYIPEADMSVRVATRWYKGPELLTKYFIYDYALDIWCFGVMMAAIIFNKEPMFRGKNDQD